jgi:hypothetical protein
VTREGDNLTLVFGDGTSTVQTFTRINDASNTRIYMFADGALAPVNDYFNLVTGDEQRAAIGYGTYGRAGDALNLRVIRWAQSDRATTRNAKDVTLEAVFNRSELRLPDGQRFGVVK